MQVSYQPFNPIKSNQSVLGPSTCQLAPVCCNCVHEPFECKFLATASLPNNFLIDNFDVITALRFIMLSRDPDRELIYEEVMRMESHCVVRRETPIWTMYENFVIKPLKLAGVIVEEDATLIQKYCGIMDVNAFEVRSGKFEVCRVVAKCSPFGN